MSGIGIDLPADRPSATISSEINAGINDVGTAGVEVVKRKLSSDDTEHNATKNLKLDNHKHADVVAEHYNQIEEKGLRERFKSPIFYLRNFNNWVKSVLISEFVEKLKGNRHNCKLNVLDICCGKGGDLIKWQNAIISHLICADIANVSVEQCKERYETMKFKQKRWAKRNQLYSAEFIVADCTKERLRSKFADPSLSLDMVSCQFGFHYCFESLPQAECMMRNISECLKPGGFFVGTMPNAYDIISRCNKNNSNYFGNKIFKIELLFDPSTDGYPLFGGKYNFQLEGVVDCPEFLVNFEVMKKLANKFQLELVFVKQFNEFMDEYKEKYYDLTKKILCFEKYPPHGGELLISSDETDYEHAKKHLESSQSNTVGTMSKSEWEATSIYLAFVFEKKKPLE